MATRQGDDYATGCFLDYQFFKNYYQLYQLYAVNLSNQNELVVDLRAVQLLEIYGMLRTYSQVSSILVKSKETVLEFYKGTTKAL